MASKENFRRCAHDDFQNLHLIKCSNNMVQIFFLKIYNQEKFQRNVIEEFEKGIENTCRERYKADGLPVDSNHNDKGGGDSVGEAAMATEGVTTLEVEDSMIPEGATTLSSTAKRSKLRFLLAGTTTNIELRSNSDRQRERSCR